MRKDLSTKQKSPVLAHWRDCDVCLGHVVVLVHWMRMSCVLSPYSRSSASGAHMTRVGAVQPFYITWDDSDGNHACRAV